MVCVPSNGNLTLLARQSSLHPSLVDTLSKRPTRPNSAGQDRICAVGRSPRPAMDGRSRRVG